MMSNATKNFNVPASLTYFNTIIFRFVAN